jgi:MFS transporter, DHA1 family, multidrug resistance protein
MPFLPLYFTELGVAEVGDVALWSGVSLGVTPALTALLAPFWGRLGDRFGRKVMVQRSLLSFVVIMAGMALVTRPWHVLVLRAVQGLFAGYGAMALTMAAESAPRERAAYAIGYVQTAQRLGPAIGPVIGGLVAGLVGLRRAFLVTSSFYVVALVLVSVLYTERGTRPALARERGRPVSFRSVLAFENFVLLMGVVFGLQFVDRTFGPILPLYVAQFGMSPARVPIVAGLVFSGVAAAGALGNQLCGVLLRRFTPRALIAASASVAAAGAFLYAAAPHPMWLFAATPLFGVAMGVAMTSTYTAASAVMPSSARGAAFGLLTTASLTGIALSPVTAGMLGATSIRGVFLLDVLALATLAVIVSRLMVTTGAVRPATPAPEEL